TAVEPVNVNLRTRESVVSTSPIACGSPVRTLKTPGGKPASLARCTSASAENGVNSDGFNTTVQPTANAGATFRVIIAAGKFHGVIAATTPTGCLSTKRRLFA